MLVLPNETRFIFEKLNNNGFECFLVGGSVRDLIMGVTPNDFDFATNATPDEIKKCFKEYKIIDIGERFGTIAVVSCSTTFEITTYRVDGNYKDSRHPDAVSFTSSIVKDLSRRDFTVNSVAYNPGVGFVDPFGGINDIYNKLIKTTGNPYDRFREDSIRIFRALRFSAKLKFFVDRETEFAMIKCKNDISLVHPQRLKKEIEELFLSDLSFDFLVKYKDIFFEVLPELKNMDLTEQNNPHHSYNVYEHTAKALCLTPKDISIRLAALFHDCGKPYTKTTDIRGVDHFKGHQNRSVCIAEDTMLKFGFPSDIRKEVCFLIKYHDERFKKGDYDIKRILNILGEKVFFKLCMLSKCDILAQSEYKQEEKLLKLDNIAERARIIISERQCYNLNMLNISGDELYKIGFRGPEIGNMLSKLFDLVINGKINNTNKELISLSKDMFDK